MQPSMELKELVLRTYAAMSNGDTSFYDNHLSRQDGVLIIGSDPDEWWTGYQTITDVFKAQMREMGGVSCLPGDPQAYSQGDVGWVADRPKFQLPDGTELPVRMSIVFAKEDGEWKVTHQHISIGVPNDQVVG
jgi:ketosteroid isomerase-like protein